MRRKSAPSRVCQKKIAEHGLEMQLVSAECAFDGSKILFFFTADGRVDFRELVKDPGLGLPHPHRAASDRRAGQGKDGRRAWHLRPPLLLQRIFGGLPARLHQDGEGAEPQPEPHQNLRHLRAADVLPEI